MRILKLWNLIKQNHAKIVSIVLNWISSVRAKNNTYQWNTIAKKITEIAENLSVMDFKVSNSWHDKFRKSHNISLKLIYGEENSVTKEHVTHWLIKIGGNCKGYEPKTYSTQMRQDFSFRVLPNRTLCFKGGKLSVP